MQIAAKATRSGSVTIETTLSQTLGFCSIRRSTASRISRSVRQYELLIAASMLARPTPISRRFDCYRPRPGDLGGDLHCRLLLSLVVMLAVPGFAEATEALQQLL
jgi:hypothetical protein